MNGLPEAGPPQFLTIEGDQLIYCQGRLAWYFRFGTGIYWVTRPEFFPKLPTLETLLAYRIEDRARLANWLTSSRAPASVPPLRTPPTPLAKPIEAKSSWPPRKKPVLPKKPRLYKRKDELTLRLYRRIDLFSWVNDHQYIEAMFRIYSQQRYRLL
jgi:hypothetical protein